MIKCVQDNTNTQLAENADDEKLEDKSFKILKANKESRKNSVVFSPIIEDEEKQCTDQLSVEDGGTETKNENTEKAQTDFDLFYPYQQRNSIFSRFSESSFRSNITAHHYSFLMSFIIIFLLGFVLGAVTVKVLVCSSDEILEDLMRTMNNTKIYEVNQINPPFL